MARTAQQVAYRTALAHWLPGASVLAAPPGGVARVHWCGPAEPVDLHVHEVPHLATRDVYLIVNRLKAASTGPRTRRGAEARLLVVAPYVRREQADVLEHAQVDYLDLAGNVHLDLPGLRVHVEGKRPPRPEQKAAAVTPGWVRFVLALLVHPELLRAPYRTLAGQAGVALGAVPRYRRDLERRGFILGHGPRARLMRREDLMTIWVHAYGTTLRPRLEEHRFRLPPALRHDLPLRLRDVLAPRGIRWTLTGAAGALLIDGYLETADTHIFLQAGALTPDLLRELRAQPTAEQADLVSIEAPGPLALEPVLLDGWPCAPLPLVYAELRYLGTERAAEAADRLMPRLLEATT